VLLTFFAIFFNNLRLFGGGFSDIYKESQEYIIKDSVNYLSTAEIALWEEENWRKFYLGQPSIPKLVLSIKKDYDFIYINPLHKSTQQMDEILMENNLNSDNVLKIRVKQNRYIYKIKH